MLDLILFPFHLAFGIIKAVFGFIGGLLSMIFSLVGGLVSFAVGAAVRGLMITLIVRAVRRHHGAENDPEADEDFVSYYDHDGTVQ